MPDPRFDDLLKHNLAAKRGVNRVSSRWGALGGTSYLGKPSCGPGLLQRLVRLRLFALGGTSLPD